MKSNTRKEIIWLVGSAAWILLVYWLITDFNVIQQLPTSENSFVSTKSILLMLFVLGSMLNGFFVVIKKQALRSKFFRKIAVALTASLALFTLFMIFYFLSVFDFTRAGIQEQLPGKMAVLLFWGGLCLTLVLRAIEIKKIASPKAIAK